MKHTPRPWIRDYEFPTDKYRHIMNGNGNGAVYIAKLPLSRCREEQEANARLIAAAPDLLEALEVASSAIRGLRKQGSQTAFWDDVEYQARAAIAKATSQ